MFCVCKNVQKILVFGPRVCSSFCPSVLPSLRSFSWNCTISFFLIWNRAWQSRIYWKKKFVQKNWENWPKTGQKQRFLNLLKNLVISFFLFNLFYNENLLCSRTNPIFGKIFVPYIWTKMFSVNQWRIF